MTAPPSDKSARDPSAYLLLHTFLGPVFGTAFILITQMFGFATPGPLSSQVHLTLSDITTVFLLFLVILLPAWFFGFIPALLHAVLMLLLRRIVPSRNLWLVLTPFIGACAVVLPLLPLLPVGSPSPGDHMAVLISAALTGAAASLCCLAIAWRRRMFPVF